MLAASAGLARGDPGKMRILVHALPARAQTGTLTREQLIIEYYSK